MSCVCNGLRSGLKAHIHCDERSRVFWCDYEAQNAEQLRFFCEGVSVSDEKNQNYQAEFPDFKNVVVHYSQLLHS